MKTHAIDPPLPCAARQRHWLWPTRRRVVTGLALALAIWGWLDVRNRGQIDPQAPWLHKTDLTVYTEAGAAFFDGRDPYAVSNIRGWTYLYPPLFAILVSPLHPLDPRTQVLVWFGISVLLSWGCYRELTRIGTIVLPETPRGPFGVIPTWLGTVAVVASAVPALNCLQRGQVGLAKLYLLLLGFRLMVSRRSAWQPVLGGCVLAAAVTLKVTPLVPTMMAVTLPWLSRRLATKQRGWPMIAGPSVGLVLGLGLWLVAVPSLLVGWQTNQQAFGTWWHNIVLRAEDTNEDDFAGNSTSLRNQSLSNAVYRFGNWAHHAFAGGPDDNGPEQLRRGGRGLLMDHPWYEDVMFGVRALASGLMLAVGFQLARRGDSLGWATAFGIACAATLVVFTIARGHYYVMLLPANVFAPLWLRAQGRRRWSLFVAVAPAVLVLAHYIALDYAGRIGVLGIGMAVWYFATCGALIWPQRHLDVSNARPEPAHDLLNASLRAA